MKDFTDRLSSLTPEQRALFESRLKRKSAGRPSTAASKAGSIPKRKRFNNCLLSFDQERIWLIDRMQPGNPAYNIYSASRLLGPLNLEAWQRAINEMVRRHEILRTTFSTIDGEPVMVIRPEFTIEVALEDASGFPPDKRLPEAVRKINEAAAQPFDLERGPLVRVGFVKLDEEDHAVHITMHHAITDRWSADVMDLETEAIYSAFLENKPSPLPPVDIQFADFAEWQRQYLQGEVLATKVDYWKEQLAGAPLVVNLPADRPRPAFQTFRGAREIINLDQPLLNALKSFTRAEGATMFMTLLAAYNTLVYRYTGQEDILIGMAMANRNRPETLNMLGYLLNMVVLRARFSPKTSFRELLGIVRTSAVGAFANLELPFGKLIDELKPPTDLSRHPVFQIAFIYLDFPEEIGVETIRVTSESLEVDNGSSRVDMTLALTERPVRLESQIEYNTDLFEGATIRRLLNHWRNMVAALVDDPDLPISDVPLMGEGEVRELLEDYNRSSVPFPDRSCVHELFDLQAGRRPEAVALLHENQHVTYGHLWARADSLSRLLKRMGVRADCCVGICMERSINMVVSLLAVLKAGGAYVPIDLSHPAARLRFIAADSKIELVLTSSGMLDTVSTNFDRFLCVAQAAGQDDCEDSGDANQSRPFPESLAYVVYTSGTTGLPKGVAVTHQGIVRLVRNANYACLDDQQVFLQLCRLSFDPATIEIWGCLLNGAKLVLMPGERTAIEDIYRTVSLHGVTTLLLPAALFHLMVDRGPEALYSVCQLLVGGEALQADHVNRFLGGAGPGRLINAYGPAEVTTNTCFHRFDRPVDPSRPVPIGRPISNTSVYILDRSLNPVPTGVKGQIFASGRGLARGYLNNADLTAERFGPNPFSRLIGDRLYSTGDLGRYLKCGNIEFLGRMDYQIKLRGFRIELGEIESMIASAANVSTVVVVLRTDHSGEKRLLAYATPKPGATLTPSQLRDRARSSLPVYMVPSSFVVLDTLPLTSSGKVDHSALPPPDPADDAEGALYEPPRNPIEEGLVEIWRLVLDRERVGIRDDFFELGGHSLLATQMVSRVREAFQIELPLLSLFENSSIEKFGEVVESLILDKLETLSEQEAADLLG